MPDPLSLDTYFTHLEEGHFFTYMYDTCTGANEATLIFYQYICSKIGPFFLKLFLPFLWVFFHTDRMLGSQTAMPIPPLFIEYNKHCAIT